MEASSQMLKPENQVPLYLQLSDLLRRNILARPEAEGKLMSIREIAAQYRVSPMTVVKAVNQLKADGMLSSHRGRGLFFNTRNRRAIQQAATPTKIIGVTFLDVYNISGAFISEVIRGLSETAADRNMRLEIFSTPSEAGFTENSFFAGIIREKRLDGMILATRMPLRDVALLQATKIPFVWINVDIPGENVSCVCSSKIEALNIALLHLKKLRHKKIALLCAEEDQAMQAALRAMGAGYGLNCRFLFQPGPELETGYILAQRAVNEINPDVLLTRGSELTASALSYLAEAHRRVPDDLALVGILSGRRQPFVPRNITFVHTDAGSLTEVSGAPILNPTHHMHAIRSCYEGFVSERDSYLKHKGFDDPVIVTGDMYNLDPLGYMTKEELAATRDLWTTSNHIGAFYIAIRYHPNTVGVSGFRPMAQFMTRYSALLWARDVKLLVRPEKIVNVDSNREVWWNECVYERETKKYRDLLIHVINSPENENFDLKVARDPPAAKQVEVEVKLPEKSKKVRVWALQMYAFESSPQIPMQTELQPLIQDGKLLVELPEFKYHTLVVVRQWK